MTLLHRRSWIKLFEPTPSSEKNVDVLDGLRAIAVVAIFVRHSWGLSGSPKLILPFDWVGLPRFDLSPFVIMSSNGVDLFFVLSGYLLSRPFISSNLAGREQPNLRNYFSARLFRILPGYWFALFVMVSVFLPALLGERSVFSIHGALAIFGHIPVLQTLFPFAYGTWGPASVYWTLTIEVVFYLALPWFVRLFYGRRAIWGLFLSLLVTLMWLTIARFLPPASMSWIAENSWRNDATASFVRFWLSKQFLAYSFSFAVGIFVANLTLHADHLARRRNPFHAPLVFIIGALLTAFSMHWLGLRSLQNSFFDGIVLIETTSFESLAFYYLEGISMALGFGLILYGLIVSSEERWTVPFRFSALRVIGILGYGIYLWHMPFLYLYTKLPFLGRMSLMQHWFVLMLMTAIPVLAVSIFSFFAIERPAQNLGRRISQRRIS